MAEAQARHGAAHSADAVLRREAGERFAFGDVFFRRLTLSAALILVLIFVGMIATLAAGAAPTFRAFGLGFITGDTGSPASGKFGAGAAVFGTLVTSAITIAIAGPARLGVAIFVSELCRAPCAGRSAPGSKFWRVFRASSTEFGASVCSRPSSGTPFNRR
jgi:phosphate transport system permease protein